jgi:glycosyltransferase involved in cell wall biosynthesis
VKVLYLAPWSHRPGPLSRRTFLDEEIRALADAGIDAYVLSNQILQNVDIGGVHVRAMPRQSIAERRRTLTFVLRCLGEVPLGNLADPKQCVRAAAVERRAAEVISEEGIALIHSYFAWPRGFGGLLAKAETGVPLVASLRGSDVNVIPALRYGSRCDPSFDRAFRRLMQRADATVSVSEFLRRDAIAAGAPVNRTRVILKGVRLDLFSRSADRGHARAQLAIGDAPTILVVSGLVQEKGLSDLLSAVALAKETHDFCVLICGEGPLHDQLVEQGRQLGLAETVRFCGRIGREAIRTYFSAADLFVQASIIEGSGNAILEAMASGLAVVCTDAGGPGEYVQHRVTGSVVPVAQPDAMAREIRVMLDEPELRERFGREGRRRAEAQFSYERMIADTIEMYNEVLGDRKRRPPAVNRAVV